MGKPDLAWYVPRWSCVHKEWDAIRLYILNRDSLTRILVGTVVASCLVVAGSRWAFPQMAMPSLWPLALAFPAIIAIVALNTAMHTIILPRAVLGPKGICVQHGGTATHIDPGTVTGTFLTVHAGNRVRLRVCYTRKSKLRSRVIGIPSTVDLNQLCQLLPIPPVVRDARDRSRVRANTMDRQPAADDGIPD